MRQIICMPNSAAKPEQNGCKPTLVSLVRVNDVKDKAQRTTILILQCLITVAAIALGGQAAFGHATGETYIFVTPHKDHIEGRIEVRAEDLALKLSLPVSDRPSANELAAVLPIAQDYLKNNFAISSDGTPLTLNIDKVEALNVPQGSYAQFFFTARGAVGRMLTVRSELFFENDPLHRNLLLFESKPHDTSISEENSSLIFGSHNIEQTLDLENIPQLPRVRTFIWQGVIHIWYGFDHVLFIIALLLPAVLRRKKSEWQPYDSFWPAFRNILIIATVFTVAHSITLALASLSIISLPSALVESAIAASIIVMAINNLWPKFNQHALWLVFVFGLIHGLGFASVMGELAFRTAVLSHLLAVILSFNIGVELGQIAIIAVVFPILYALRNTSIYQPVILVGGSIVVAVIAIPWLLERSLGIPSMW